MLKKCWQFLVVVLLSNAGLALSQMTDPAQVEKERQERALAYQKEQEAIAFLAGKIKPGIEQNQAKLKQKAKPSSLTQLLRGTISQISGNRLSFRTAKASLEIDLGKLDAETVQAINQIGKKARFTLPISQAAIVSETDVPHGVRSDCSELPLDYDELINLGLKAPKGDMQSFLEAIPEGTMQNFTFVYDSKSLQNEGVTDLYPRVLRFNRTGKLMFSYTCNPKSPNYGTVEIMRFDDATNTFKTSNLDFRVGLQEGELKNWNKQLLEERQVHSEGKPYIHNPPISDAAGVRYKENPRACIRCHDTGNNPGNPSIRPNWAQYPSWPGTYGSNDDRMKKEDEETKKFLNFRQKQKDNPCYASLPWGNDIHTPEYALYPYSDKRKTSDYHLRPNLKITETYAHLNAKRVAQKLKDSPVYNYVKNLIAMEGAGCELPSDVDDIIKNSGLSNYALVSQNSGRDFDPRKDASTRRLYSIGKALGFTDAEWTLFFNDPDNPDFNTGMTSASRVGDTPIARVVQGEVLKDIALENPDIADLVRTSRGESAAFGPKFSCIDNIGGHIVLPASTDDHKKLCDRLAGFQKKAQQELDLARANGTFGGNAAKPDCMSVVVAQTPIGITNLMQGSGKVLGEADKEKIAQGKKVVEDTCKKCHVPGGTLQKLPDFYQFFKDEDTLKQTFKTEPSLPMDMVEMVNDGDMPPSDRFTLSNDEKEAVKSYIMSLTLP